MCIIDSSTHHSGSVMCLLKALHLHEATSKRAYRSLLVLVKLIEKVPRLSGPVHKMLQEYKLGVLTNIVTNWEKNSNEEQQSMAQMFNYFCYMHLVINIAEHVSVSLKLFEQAHLKKQQRESGCGTMRLIRRACKPLRREEMKSFAIHFNSMLICIKQQNTDGIRACCLSGMKGDDRCFDMYVYTSLINKRHY